MSILSERLAAVRKEKNIAQKAAACELGVSQALLSHYEKGIRECSPAFLARAAVYYGVSADYLLGVSEEKKNEDAFFAAGEISADDDATPQTIYRAMRQLQECAAALSPTLGARVLTMYQYTAYQLAKELGAAGLLRESPVRMQKENGDFYLAVAQQADLKRLRACAENLAGDLGICPRCLKTVVGHSEELIRKSVDGLRVET